MKKTFPSIPVVLVTPEQAKEWLDTRFDNERPLRSTHAASLARDMENGNWIFTGEPIRFHEGDGRLIDGQHRLQAIVQSNTSQYMAVVNLPLEARKAINTQQATRSISDLLKYEGYSMHVHGRVMAAIIRRLLLFKRGQGTAGGTYRPTPTEMLEFAKAHKQGLEQATSIGTRAWGYTLPLAASAVGTAYFLCAEKHEEQADEFFDKLVTGLGLAPGDPVAALRSRAARHMTLNHGRRMQVDDAFRYILLSWNHFRQGNKVHRLVGPRGGWTRDNVPEVM